MKQFNHIVFSFNNGLGKLSLEEGLDLNEKMDEKFFIKNNNVRAESDQIRSKVIDYLSKKQSQAQFILNLPATMACLQKTSKHRFYLVTDTTVSAARKHLYDQCLDNFFDSYYGFEHTLSMNIVDAMKECIYNLPQGESFAVVTNDENLINFCNSIKIPLLSLNS